MRFYIVFIEIYIFVRQYTTVMSAQPITEEVFGLPSQSLSKHLDLKIKVAHVENVLDAMKKALTGRELNRENIIPLVLSTWRCVEEMKDLNANQREEVAREAVVQLIAGSSLGDDDKIALQLFVDTFLGPVLKGVTELKNAIVSGAKGKKIMCCK